VRLSIAITAAVVAAVAVGVFFGNNRRLSPDRPSTSPPAHSSDAVRNRDLPVAAGVKNLPKTVGSFIAELAEIQTADGQRLLALYKAGIDQAATAEQKYIAMQITMACNGYVNPRTLTRQSADAMSQLPAGDPRRATMEDKLDELANRCAPLATIGREAWHAETLLLGASLSAAGSPFAPISLTNQDGTSASDEQLDQARQQIRNTLDAYGPLSLNWVASGLLGLAASGQGQPGQINLGGAGTPSFAAAVAMAIAPCLAGQACDSNSLFGMGMCVGSGGVECGDSVEASMLSELPDDESRNRANLLANEVLGAIAARDWGRLGL
jgi:hypothetical protein